MEEVRVWREVRLTVLQLWWVWRKRDGEEREGGVRRRERGRCKKKGERERGRCKKKGEREV